MADLTTHKELCRNFAALFNYPNDQVIEQAKQCLLEMKQVNAQAVVPLAAFVAFAEANPLSRIEETFTAAFDLQPLCHPYIGYQLCGESQQRTLFMLKLRELYRQYDFEAGNELPDHLIEVLRFVGSIDDCTCRDELIDDGLLPALEKLTQGVENQGNPYLGLLFSVQSFLAAAASSEIEPMPTARQKECLS